MIPEYSRTFPGILVKNHLSYEFRIRLINKFADLILYRTFPENGHNVLYMIIQI